MPRPPGTTRPPANGANGVGANGVDAGGSRARGRGGRASGALFFVGLAALVRKRG